MADSHTNFAYSTIATAPSPSYTGTEIVVQAGDGVLFPPAPFNATVWPSGTQPTSTNAEIVRVTNVSTDTFTIQRQQESSGGRQISVGDQIAATITKQTIVVAENIMSRWSPFILASAGTGVQSLASASGQSSSGSLFVFPVTARNNLKFNNAIVLNQLSYVTSANAGQVNNTYKSLFGLYSMNGNTLSLISSNSFSIAETLNSVSLTWYYPSLTNETGYEYGSFPGVGNLTTTAQFSSYISGSRAIGLNFGGPMNLNEGIYYIGLLSGRSTAGSSTYGLSNVGIVGQIINQINSVGTQSGVLPLGLAASQWSLSNSHKTGWFGRHLIGFLTATTVTNYLGTAIPDAITISQLGAVAAASTVSVLPTVSFASID